MRAVLTYFLPVGRELDEDQERRHRLMVAFLLVTASYAISYIPVSIAIDYNVALVSIAITAVNCVILCFALRNGVSIVWVANIYLANLALSVAFLWASTGGLTITPNDPAFMAFVPVIALLLVGKRWALFWLGTTLVMIAGSGVPGVLGEELPVGMNVDWVPAFLVISILGHSVLLYIFTSLFETSRDRAQRNLEEANEALAVEQQKTEELLLNILPAEVAEELKETGAAEAHEFDAVTILFTDFKNFTEISSDMTPQDLVAELNACFFAFDELMGTFHLEKIKTIGDAYMAASGLPHEHGSFAADVVKAALEMQAFLSERKKENDELSKPSFEMRAGIHTGPVVAGIVGVKKFQYDIWGDTVNTASRMESSGESGKVNISQATYDLVKDEPGLRFVPRGEIEAKGKGELAMYFADVGGDSVDGRETAAQAEAR